MKHNCRCENANPKGRCTCRCGGKFHGMARNKETFEFVRTINAQLGGEVETLLNSLTNEVLKCTCRKNITLRGFLGYPHRESGYKDADGMLWWIYVECPKCHYQWSADKIIQRLKILKIRKEKSRLDYYY